MIDRLTKSKKGSRQLAQARLREHIVKGRRYYTYCRGTDKEIYLGTADAILKAVRQAKLKVADKGKENDG